MKECTQTGNWTPKYNFVFLFARYEYYRSIFGDAFYNKSYARVYRLAFSGNGFLQKLFRIHWSYSLNRKFTVPLKSVWFRRIYRQNFNEDRPLCFVYIGGNSIRYDGGLTKYIQKKDKTARQILLHMDLISKKCKYDYSIIRNKVDAAVTYDREEAEKYGINWYPGRFYNRTLPLTEPAEFETDVYFLGNAKDRLDQILAVYHQLRAQQLRCRFLLTGVPQERQENLEGIQYINGISYEENLKHVQACKCILEIGQHGSNAATLRLSEAVTYHRLLLSNCIDIKKCDYYIPETMSLFRSPEEMDLEALKKDIPYEVFQRRNIDFSMDRFLQYLEQILEEREQG